MSSGWLGSMRRPSAEESLPPSIFISLPASSSGTPQFDKKPISDRKSGEAGKPSEKPKEMPKSRGDHKEPVKSPGDNKSSGDKKPAPTGKPSEKPKDTAKSGGDHKSSADHKETPKPKPVEKPKVQPKTSEHQTSTGDHKEPAHSSSSSVVVHK